jgi:hypothetical protein
MSVISGKGVAMWRCMMDPTEGLPLVAGPTSADPDMYEKYPLG